MKAVVLNVVGRGFDFEDVDIATPIGHEVLVDVRAAGLCHPDPLLGDEARGVPLSMNRIQSEFLGADLPSRLLLANLLVREEPDDEEDEDDDDRKEGDDEDKEDDEGYSE